MIQRITNRSTANCVIILTGCPSTLKNNDGKLARIIAKENEHKEAMKECKKAEKMEAKGRGSKAGTEPWAIRVRFSHGSTSL
jgi:hypothetical protein